MFRLSVRLLLLLVICATLGLSTGCRRKPMEPASPPTPEVPVDTSTIPVLTPASGAPMPAATTEMMMKFEARFGRPPTNYTELSRLQTPPPAPKPR